MEVHPHTHAERKKWNHYFFDFLMLFLAVFAGFLAENWREHSAEHITQITQSGNLRYFTNIQLIKKISAYYSRAQYITTLNSIDRGFREKAMELKARVLDNYFFSKYSSYPIVDWPHIPDSLMNGWLPVHSTDRMNEFANSLENRRTNFSIFIKRVYPEALSASLQLMDLLRKEYDLK